jgi:hypothetical protein
MDPRFCAICGSRADPNHRKNPSSRPSSLVGTTAWWLAVDTQYTSYAELKARHVIAQGWPRLGDLSLCARMAGRASNRELFEDSISRLCVQHYAQDDGRAKQGLWRFFQIGDGDLVVAIEGTTVRGVTKMLTGAADGYWLDKRFHYAQCIGKEQVWIDWPHSTPAPRAPARGVLAAAHIGIDIALVARAWDRIETKE